MRKVPNFLDFLSFSAAVDGGGPTTNQKTSLFYQMANWPLLYCPASELRPVDTKLKHTDKRLGGN